MPNPFCHIELTTDDLKAAQKFYGKVFAWKLSEMPGMPYTMIDVGGGTGGGMQLRPMPDAPTGWMPYVEVSDVKAAVAKAAKAGAKVMLPYHEIPGGMGALGVFADPQGSVIGVWEPGKKAPASPPEKAVAKKAGSKKVPAKKAPAAKKAVAAKKAPAPAKKAPAPVKKAPAKKKGK
jgi:predicted enzyme related to lactoylglutathione lyase